jgi:hypothetical protein
LGDNGNKFTVEPFPLNELKTYLLIIPKTNGMPK